MDDNMELELWNTQVEMIVLGSLFARPEEAGFSYIGVINNSDFHDPMTAYFHAFFNDYVSTYSNEITEEKANIFASMDQMRLKGYKKFGYFKSIKSLISFATHSDEELKNQVDILKKWSVLRQLHKNGYDVSKIVHHPRFNSLTADACANIIRGNLDKICTKIITGLDDPIDLSDNVLSLMDGFLEAPERGHDAAWDFINSRCSGIMKHDSYCIAMNSNQGKGRSLIYLATHLALVEGAKVAFFGNEMDYNSMQLACLSVVNNSPAIQNLHGNEIHIPEKRFKTGAYLDANGNIVYRKTDSNGVFSETIEQFKNRLSQVSQEYRNVQNAMKWFEEEGKNKIWFKNCAANYSDENLQRLVRQAIYQHSVDVWFYDTLKHGTGTDMSKWSDLVQTTTRLCELNATLPTAAIMSAQLNNSAHLIRPEEMTNAQLSSASYIYHLFDVMITMQHLKPEWYNDYVLQVQGSNGKMAYKNLDTSRHLTVANLIKNRRGGKAMYLIDSNLDTNVWLQNQGTLIPRSAMDNSLPWVDDNNTK